MERLTKKYFNDNEVEPYVCAGIEYCGDSYEGEVISRLAEYEDTGLTPEEVARLHTLIEQQGKELKRRDKLIRELDKERDYWERESKRHCAQLGEIRILAGQEPCYEQ